MSFRKSTFCYNPNTTSQWLAFHYVRERDYILVWVRKLLVLIRLFLLPWNPVYYILKCSSYFMSSTDLTQCISTFEPQNFQWYKYATTMNEIWAKTASNF